MIGCDPRPIATPGVSMDLPFLGTVFTFNNPYIFTPHSKAAGAPVLVLDAAGKTSTESSFVVSGGSGSGSGHLTTLTTAGGNPSPLDQLAMVLVRDYGMVC